jgi:hypothetical protein
MARLSGREEDTAPVALGEGSARIVLARFTDCLTIGFDGTSREVVRVRRQGCTRHHSSRTQREVEGWRRPTAQIEKRCRRSRKPYCTANLYCDGVLSQPDCKGVGLPNFGERGDGRTRRALHRIPPASLRGKYLRWQGTISIFARRSIGTLGGIPKPPPAKAKAKAAASGCAAAYKTLTKALTEFKAISLMTRHLESLPVERGGTAFASMLELHNSAIKVLYEKLRRLLDIIPPDEDLLKTTMSMIDDAIAASRTDLSRTKKMFPATKAAAPSADPPPEEEDEEVVSAS